MIAFALSLRFFVDQFIMLAGVAVMLTVGVSNGSLGNGSSVASPTPPPVSAFEEATIWTMSTVGTLLMVAALCIFVLQQTGNYLFVEKASAHVACVPGRCALSILPQLVVSLQVALGRARRWRRAPLVGEDRGRGLQQRAHQMRKAVASTQATVGVTTVAAASIGWEIAIAALRGQCGCVPVSTQLPRVIGMVIDGMVEDLESTARSKEMAAAEEASSHPDDNALEAATTARDLVETVRAVRRASLMALEADLRVDRCWRPCGHAVSVPRLVTNALLAALREPRLGPTINLQLRVLIRDAVENAAARGALSEMLRLGRVSDLVPAVWRALQQRHWPARVTAGPARLTATSPGGHGVSGGGGGGSGSGGGGGGGGSGGGGGGGSGGDGGEEEEVAADLALICTRLVNVIDLVALRPLHTLWLNVLLGQIAWAALVYAGAGAASSVIAHHASLRQMYVLRNPRAYVILMVSVLILLVAVQLYATSRFLARQARLVTRAVLLSIEATLDGLLSDPHLVALARSLTDTAVEAAIAHLIGNLTMAAPLLRGSFATWGGTERALQILADYDHSTFRPKVRAAFDAALQRESASAPTGAALATSGTPALGAVDAGGASSTPSELSAVVVAAQGGTLAASAVLGDGGGCGSGGLSAPKHEMRMAMQSAKATVAKAATGIAAKAATATAANAARTTAAKAAKRAEAVLDSTLIELNEVLQFRHLQDRLAARAMQRAFRRRLRPVAARLRASHNATSPLTVQQTAIADGEMRSRQVL